MFKFIVGFCLFFTISANAQQPYWKQTNGPSGFNTHFEFNSKGHIFCVGRPFLRSTDDGASWKDITPTFFSGNVYGWSVSSHDDLFVSTDSLLYRSHDNGDSWSIVLKNVSGGWISVSKTGAIYVGALPNLWRSLDDGATWTNIASHMPYAWHGYNIGITSTGELTFINRLDTICYFSMDNGNSWSKKNILPFRMMSYALQSTSNGYLYSGYAQRSTATDVENGFAIRSTDNGMTWDSINRGNALVISSNDVLVEFVSPDSVQYSTDYGITWSNITLPESNALYNYNYYFNEIDQKGNIYWSLAYTNMRYNTVTKTVQVLSLPIGKVNNLLVEKNGSILSQGEICSISTDVGQHWVAQPGFNDSIYSGRFYAFANDSSGGIVALGPGNAGEFFRSTDGGATWLIVHQLNIEQVSGSFLSNHQIVITPNGNIFICGVDYNIMRSFDLGNTWDNKVSSGLPGRVFSLSCDRSGILYTFSGQSIYRSTDNGTSWQFMINIIDPFLFKHIVTTSSVTSLIVTPKNEIFAGTTRDGVIMSSDQGMTWKVVSEQLDSAHISALYAAPNGDVYGISKGGSLKDGIIYLPYQGSQWYNANDGLGNVTDLTTMAFASDGTVYLGTNGRGVWRSQGSVNAVHSARLASDKISLNISPNPVSSNAILTYSLPDREFVKLDLCDPLGRILATFANNIENAGEHSMKVGLNGLTNGIYFVRLSTPTGSVIEKIIISK